MDDLISSQAAIDAILKVPDGNWSQKRYAQEIRKQPPVDAVPVVRCRDCKRYQHEVGDDEYALGWCPFLTIHLVSRDGFCAWGKRKEDGNAKDGLPTGGNRFDKQST